MPLAVEKAKAGYKTIGFDVQASIVEDADLVVVTTMHNIMDYDFVQKHAKFIFDTRNALKNIKNRQNVELL